MAIALDQNLGSNHAAGAATTITLTTSAAAAAGTRIVVTAGNFGAETPSTCAGGGLTWVRDFLDDDANNVTSAVFSADAPAGLASSTVLTVTYSASASSRSITGQSFTEIATGASGYLTGTPSAQVEFGTTDWVTPNITTTVADALLVSNVLADSAGGATGTVTSPATEINDAFDATTTMEILTGYRVVAATGTYSIAGTFGSAPGEQKYSIVGYATSAAPPAVPNLQVVRAPATYR